MLRTEKSSKSSASWALGVPARRAMDMVLPCMHATPKGWKANMKCPNSIATRQSSVAFHRGPTRKSDTCEPGKKPQDRAAPLPPMFSREPEPLLAARPQQPEGKTRPCRLPAQDCCSGPTEQADPGSGRQRGVPASWLVMVLDSAWGLTAARAPPRLLRE